MKNTFVYLFILVAIFSCNNNKETRSIIGLWAFYSNDMGYTEANIDSQTIDGMNQNEGGMFPMPYIYRNDSLIFTESDFKYKVDFTSDTSFRLISKTEIFVLCKIDTVNTYCYNFINNTEEEIDQFLDQFFERSNKHSYLYDLWIDANFTKHEPDSIRILSDPLVKIRESEYDTLSLDNEYAIPVDSY